LIVHTAQAQLSTSPLPIFPWFLSNIVSLDHSSPQ
jgi:hypothetical protein